MRQIYKTADMALRIAQTAANEYRKRINIFHAYDAEGTYWIVSDTNTDLARDIIGGPASLATWRMPQEAAGK